MGKNKRHRDKTLRDRIEGQGRHKMRQKVTAKGLLSTKPLKKSCTPQSWAEQCQRAPQRGIWGWHCSGPRPQAVGQALAKDVPQLSQTSGLCPEIGLDGLDRRHCPRSIWKSGDMATNRGEFTYVWDQRSVCSLGQRLA